jgi:DNA mismatch repair protein MutL
MNCRIVLLDDATANRIAAGEVVERPASALKELVENAIDAGARHIDIRLEEGGRRLIQVADDGCGMTAEEAVLALQRHATSKLRTADDLFNIRTLGFRGEALPSIASVSRFSLLTRTEEDPGGVRVEVVGGIIEETGPASAAPGTVITVEDLFYNTPARRKFLKSITTEASRCVDVVGQLAIAHPGVAFRVESNGQLMFSTTGSGEAVQALASVWGRDLARSVFPILREEPGLKVFGHVAPPERNRPGRSHELFYVNGRPIKSRMLSHALEDAFRSLTPDSRFPIGAVFLEIDPAMVDVNVHPTKTEVKFAADGHVHHAVSQAVKQALLDRGMVPQISLASSDTASVGTAGGWSGFGGMRQNPMPTQVAAAMEAFAPIADFLPSPSQENLFEEFTAAGAQMPYKPFAEQLRGYRVLAQARNTYILALTESGLAIIDQHVAHERVLFEYLTVKRAAHGTPSQLLAVPFTLSLGSAEAALLAQRLEDFGHAGWQIEPFGRDTFVVRAVPTYVQKRQHEALLRDMIDELVHQSVSRRLLVQRDHVTITNACKMAVKAGDPLTMEEMVGLLHQLADTENPYMCPHGRPIVVTVPFDEIDRRFKR